MTQLCESNSIECPLCITLPRAQKESVVEHDSFTLSDIMRPSLLVLDSHLDDGLGPTGGSTPTKQTAIILEESNERGFFMQENETTASGAHGDNILLESRTGFGVNDKLELESDRIIVENKINEGTIPFSNFVNSTFEPFGPLNLSKTSS